MESHALFCVCCVSPDWPRLQQTRRWLTVDISEDALAISNTFTFLYRCWHLWPCRRSFRHGCPVLLNCGLPCLFRILLYAATLLSSQSNQHVWAINIRQERRSPSHWQLLYGWPLKNLPARITNCFYLIQRTSRIKLWPFSTEKRPFSESCSCEWPMWTIVRLSHLRHLKHLPNGTRSCEEIDLSRGDFLKAPHSERTNLAD